jgi:hypothetical protein
LLGSAIVRLHFWVLEEELYIAVTISRCSDVSAG